MNPPSLNAVYSSPRMRRRYEVWFLRFLLADGSGAWWLRYLLMDLGRPGGGGCADNPRGQPVQVWATWFPRNGLPQSFIQGFPQDQLSLSDAGAAPFHLQLRENRIEENACAGKVTTEGHWVEWDLRYRSTAGYTVSDKGWIGFSRTPHSDAIFSGEIALDGKRFRGDPLGYGLQGHNCGFRHRNLWSWAHACFLGTDGSGMSTFEALEYEMPFGLRFRRAGLLRRGQLHVFKKLKVIGRVRETLQWAIQCSGSADGLRLVADFNGRGASLHRLPYLKTDCSETFEVSNNSLARAALYLNVPGQATEQLRTEGGAVLEMSGG